MKKATIVLGSPNIRGNTARLVDAMISGMESENIIIKKYELSKLKQLNHCVGCNSCKKNDTHKCVFDDGLNDIISEARSSDLLVIASPIYFFNFNSLTKVFIDRLFYSSELDNDNNLLKGKNVAMLITYGLDNVMESGAKNALQSFYDISKFVGLKIAGIVYGSIGDNDKENDILLHKARSLGELVGANILG